MGMIVLWITNRRTTKRPCIKRFSFLLRYVAEDQPWDAVRLTIAYLHARHAFVSDDMRTMLAEDKLLIKPELADESLFCLFDDFGNIMVDVVSRCAADTLCTKLAISA